MGIFDWLLGRRKQEKSNSNKGVEIDYPELSEEQIENIKKYLIPSLIDKEITSFQELENAEDEGFGWLDIFDDTPTIHYLPQISNLKLGIKESTNENEIQKKRDKIFDNEFGEGEINLAHRLVWGWLETYDWETYSIVNQEQIVQKKLRVNEDEMEDIEDITHYKGVPFTGIGIRLFENNECNSETNFKDGLKHGIQTIYHNNGKIFIKARYENDKRINVMELNTEDGGNMIDTLQKKNKK